MALSWVCFGAMVSMMSTCVVAAPLILSEPQDITVLVGQDLILECQIQDRGQSYVFWKKGESTIAVNDEVFAPWNSHMLVEQEDMLHDLTISTVTLQDEDIYQCEVPGAGSVSYTVTVNQPPVLNLEPDTEQVEEVAGTDITLACLAEGKPLPTVVWSRTDGQPLRSGDMTQEGERLVLPELKEEDTSDYLCQASNVAGTVDEIIQLLVRFAPEVTVGTSNVHTGPGDDVSIDCTFHASPEAAVDWTHNGSTIDRETRTNLNIRTEGEKWILQITDLLPRDLGTYSCIGGNSYGSDAADVILSAIPEGLRITSEPEGDYSDAFNLKWEVGSVAPLAEYDLQYRQVSLPGVNASEDWDKWQEVSVPANPSSSDVVSDSYTIRDLQANVTYAALLRARNEFGESEWTPEFRFTTSDEGKSAPLPTTKPPTPETEKPQSSLSQESKVTDPTPEPRSTTTESDVTEVQEEAPSEDPTSEDVVEKGTPGSATTSFISFWLLAVITMMFTL